MSTFKITGQMKVKTLKENFKEYFNSVLRVYEKNHFADDDKTLAAIRDENAKGGEFECGDMDTVGNFANFMKELYGIKVKVATPDDSRLVDDNLKLGDVKNIGAIKRRGAKKRMKYVFNGEEFTVKGRLCHAVIKHYAEQHPEARIGDLQELFRVHNKDQVVMLKEDAKNVPDYRGIVGKCFYLDGSDDIEIRGGIASVWNYWPENYFGPFMEIVAKLGYKVEVIDVDNVKAESQETKIYNITVHFYNDPDDVFGYDTEFEGHNIEEAMDFVKDSDDFDNVYYYVIESEDGEEFYSSEDEEDF